MSAEPSIVERLYEALVDEVRRTRPELLTESFTVAEIYQNLVPYRTHRERVGAEMNGDYEHALLRLLAGEGDYVSLESDAARSRFEEELNSIHPDTGVYRNFAACEVRLRPERLEDLGEDTESDAPPEGPVSSDDQEEGEAVESDAVEWEDGEGDDGDEARAGDEAGDDSDAGVELDLGPDASVAHADGGAVNGDHGAGDGAEVDAAITDADNGSDGAASGSGVAVEDVDHGAEPGGTCLWCRESLPDRDDLRFCPFCGSSVDLRPCPQCGAEVEADWIFCIACGAEAAD